MSARRILPLAAVLAAGALVLSGCIPLPFLNGGGSNTVNTSTGEDVDPALEPYYTQDLTWSSLGGRRDETTVTVPLDWDDPAGDTIEIAVARNRAGGDATGSMLMNPGGPGGSGYDFVAQSAEYVVTPDVLANYDLIGFDPRGVGRSTGIECYTDGADKDELLYGTFTAEYGTQAWVDELTARQLDWVDACVANTGDLMGNLDAASVARDMDVLRAVLGDEKMTFLGYSYGTYLGAVYAELFPAKVGRMVLDGAVDPLVGDLEALATQMAGFESAYRAFLQFCFDEGGCPFTGGVEPAMQQTEDLILSAGALGLTSNDGRELDEATIGTGLINMLYAQWLWPNLVQMLTDLQAGDAQSTFDSADEYNSRIGPGRYDGNGYDIYTAVTCNEGTLGTDGVTPLEGLSLIEQTAPYLGFATALDDYVALDATCSNWPYPVAELPATFTADGAPPILVIGTTNDPATPYSNAVSLAQQLSSGVLITYNGEGHTIYSQGVACVDSTVDAYLLRGEVPSADPNC